MSEKLISVCIALMALLLFSCAASGENTARDITSACSITASDTKKAPSAALDGNIKTYWEASKNGVYIEIKLPDGVTAGGVQVEWFREPAAYEFTQYDKDGKAIGKQELSDSFVCICEYFELEAGTRKVRISCVKGGEIARIHVYSDGALPGTVQVWQSPAQKADIMLISTHQDDELLWFGGAIPYYSTVRGNSVQLVYMTTCGRLRRAEALKGLWVMGVRNYPVFLNLRDKKVKTKDEGLSLWGGKDKVTGMLVECIRKYKPEVVLCQDIDGEYGHWQHRITSELVLEAVIAAADPEEYIDTCEEYGAWLVKKVYRHLGDENVISMDWETPAEELNGKTPLEVAALGFAQHASQQKNWSMNDGRKYDNTKFSLVFTDVGEDVYRDDFLENTAADPRRTDMPSLTATPEPTATSAPTATPEPTATSEPAATNEPAAAPEPVKAETGFPPAAAALILTGICAIIGITVAARRRAANRRNRKQLSQKRRTYK